MHAFPHSRSALGRIALGRAALVAGILLSTGTASRGQLGFGDTVPGQDYFSGTEAIYRGEYRDAVRTLNSGLRGAVKTVNARWIDSICYYAMLGEAYYQAGQPRQALQQFDAACSMILQYPQWMLRVQFDNVLRPDAARARRIAPWGTSGRQAPPANIRDQMLYSQGQLDNSQAVATGGAVNQLQFWQVNVVEIVRASALAMRRRNELLGPLAKYDKTTTDLLRVFSRGGAPPNHWSNSWILLQRGIAHAGAGEREQANQRLDQAILIAGQFDHPLTCAALLELGRLAMEAGDSLAAENLLAEASFSAFRFEDPSVVDEAFRLVALNRMRGEAEGVSPLWAPASAWARRERLDHVAARCELSAGEELVSEGDLQGATTMLRDAQSRMRDARVAPLGIAAAALDARLQFEQRRDSAAPAMAAVVLAQAKCSHRNLQIALANEMFDAQTLTSRSAMDVYAQLLADPGAADLALRFLDSLAVMKTPNEPAFARWLEATLERNNAAAALEIADLAKRRRYHQMLPWGGWLDSVRLAFASPTDELDPAELRRRREAAANVPQLAAALSEEAALRRELLETWVAEPAPDVRRQLGRLWKEFGQAVARRESAVAAAALARVPAEFAFPPRIDGSALQQQLEPGQAVLAFHDTPQGLVGILLTSKAASLWNCGPSGRVGAAVTEFLRALGNFDGNREVSTEDLASEEWHAASDKVQAALLGDMKHAPHAIRELVVIPDGVAWYVPFEALWIEGEDRSAPWISFTQIRYAPTVGLAYRRGDVPWRRIRRTGFELGNLVAGKDPEDRAAATESLRSAVDGSLVIGEEFPAPGYLAAMALDGLVVLDDLDATGPDQLGWNPLPLSNDRNGALSDWLIAAGAGPQRIALPGLHTRAENGGRSSRRSGDNKPGDELFAASCTLMSAGVETALLSRWRVGGQSTLQLVQDFLQEAPNVAAADAWQRSVQLAMETPIDPLNEQRVRQAKSDESATAAHPFMWGGYLVLDSGWRPAEQGEDQQDEVAGTVAEAKPAAVGEAAAPAAAPAAGPAEGADRAESPPPPASK